jgi:putative aldouronate transport system substrate-binding protein
MRRSLMVLTVMACCLAMAVPLFAGAGSETPQPAAGAAQWKVPYNGPTVELSTWMMSGMENPQDYADKASPYMTEWMKRLGSGIKWKVFGNAVADYDARFAILAANGPLYDFNVTRSAVDAAINYGASGQMLDLMPYVEAGKMPNLKKNYLDKYPTVLTVCPTGPNGKKQLFAVGAMQDGVEMPEAWLYNKTILDKYGVAVPTTSDEFLAAMKKLKAADPAIVPFIYMWSSYADIAWYSGLHYMFSKYRNTNINWDPDQQKWVHGALEPNAHLKDMLIFMNQMYTAGLFNPDQETQKGDAWTKLAQSGKWGFTFTYYANARVLPTGNGMVKAGAATAYQIAGMYVPKGPNGLAVTNWGTRDTGGPGWGVTISSKTKYPDLAVALVDNLYSDDSLVFFNYGIQGVTYQKAADGALSFLPEWNTAINPNGYKDLDKFGLGSALIPYAHNNLTAARFARYYAPEVLAMASYQLRGLYNGKITTQVLEFARPPVTTVEGDLIGKTEGPINTYMEENVVKFIKGQRSFDDWDKFVQDVKNLGVQKILDIYNAKPRSSYIVPEYWTKAELLKMLTDMGQKP